jgi:hypothetical protein
MTKPLRFHLAVAALGLALLGLAVGLAIHERFDRCTCVYGGADFFDAQTDDPSDCAKHGAMVE